MKEKRHLVIVGAGVVGCSIALKVSEAFPDLTVTIVESRSGPGQVTSRTNSGVIHSGMHLKPGSLKAQFALKGSWETIEYCQKHDVPFSKCGMIVAASPSDLKKILTQWRGFTEILRRGRAQGVDLQMLMPWKVAQLEPSLRTIGGLYVPSVCIIDQQAFVCSLQSEAERRGACFVFDETACAIARLERRFIVKTSVQRELVAHILINAAGLYADRIAKLAAGLCYPVFPYRGEYYEVVSETHVKQIHRLVYPVTTPGQAGLGIHLTPTVDGRLLIGPNARRVPSVDFLEEDKTPEDEFRSAVAKFWPAVKTAELRWAFAGIRPKIVESGEGDFLIRVDNTSPLLINLIGIESPGFTAALPIGAYVTKILSNNQIGTTS